jgi:hypothetical protein
MEKPKINLPALVQDLGIAIKVDNFNTLLNADPPASWYKTHNKRDYIPIDRVKNTLTIIYQDYDWEIQDVRVIANSIVVWGNLYIVSPITGKQRKLAGIGAWPIQLRSGSDPTDFSAIISDAIQKNAPAAESLALKNAASKLGKIFGGGDQDIDFVGIFSKEVPLDDIKNSLLQSR